MGPAMVSVGINVVVVVGSGVAGSGVAGSVSSIDLDRRLSSQVVGLLGRAVIALLSGAESYGSFKLRR